MCKVRFLLQYAQLPCDLLLNGLSVGLSEQVEQATREVMCVGIGVPQLVGNTDEEEVPALSVHVHCQVLKDVHVAAMCNAAHTGAVALCSDDLDSLGADVPNMKGGYEEYIDPEMIQLT